MKKLNIKGFLKGLVREGLQAVPVVGTLVTNWKSNTTENPQGKIKMGRWDIYRIIIGIGITYILSAQLLNMRQVRFLLEFMGM